MIVRGDAEARLRITLRGRGLRWTAERRRVLAAVLTRSGHFTAQDLAKGAAASRATIYRALPLLVEAGVVQAMALGTDGRVYENATGRHHDHLVCTSCGKVVEFEFEAFEMLQRDLAAKYGFELLGHMHELFGRCRDCRDEPKPS
jgi:Fur family ferric uptake transcriptional regulator